MKPVLFGLAAALVVIVIVLAPAARNPAASPQADSQADGHFAAPAVVRAESVRSATTQTPAAPPTPAASSAQSPGPVKAETVRVAAAAPTTGVTPPAPAASSVPRPGSVKAEAVRVAAAAPTTSVTPPTPVASPRAPERLAAAHQHGSGENLIANGSFEIGGETTDTFMWYFPGSSAVRGWTILGEQIDYVGPYWPAAEGRRSIDLNGSPGRGGIMQTFATQTGDVYEVNFHLAGNPRGNLKGADPVKHLVVEISSGSYNTPHVYTFDTTGREINDIGWVRHCFTFRATAPSTTIRFLSQDPDYEWGPAIDNVVVRRAAP